MSAFSRNTATNFPVQSLTRRHAHVRPWSARSSDRLIWIVVLILLLFLLSNLPAIFTFVTGVQFPYSPIIVLMVSLLVLLTTAPTSHGPFFYAGVIYCAVFTIFGFMGPHFLGFTGLYGTLEAIVKHWIAIVLVPWMVMRVMTVDRIPQFVKSIVVLSCVGAILSALQVVAVPIFGAWVTDKGRGAGFWINPNCCAPILGIALILAWAIPFRNRRTNLLVQVLLITGILATLSRSGLIALMIAFVVRAWVGKDFRSLIKSVGLTVLIGLAGVLVLAGLSLEKRSSERLEMLGRMFEMRAETSADTGTRLETWQAAFQLVSEHWFTGRGHTSMVHVLYQGGRVEGGLAAHNYYLYVWGNSGILALIALLFYFGTGFKQSLRCVPSRIRGATGAIVALLVVISMFDSSILATQYAGAFLAPLTVLLRYARRGTATGDQFCYLLANGGRSNGGMRYPLSQRPRWQNIAASR
jgi:O-antigen ligase